MCLCGVCVRVYVCTHAQYLHESLRCSVGGTNFGFMNGANIGEDKQYEPDITSYGEYVQM